MAAGVVAALAQVRLGAGDVAKLRLRFWLRQQDSSHCGGELGTVGQVVGDRRIVYLLRAGGRRCQPALCREWRRSVGCAWLVLACVAHDLQVRMSGRHAGAQTEHMQCCVHQIVHSYYS